MSSIILHPITHKSCGDRQAMKQQVWAHWQSQLQLCTQTAQVIRFAIYRNEQQLISEPYERLGIPLQDCTAHLHGMRKGLE